MIEFTGYKRICCECRGLINEDYIQIIFKFMNKARYCMDQRGALDFHKKCLKNLTAYIELAKRKKKRTYRINPHKLRRGDIVMGSEVI